MVGSDVHEPRVAPDVIHTIRVHAGNSRIGEIMPVSLKGIFGRKPLPPMIRIVSEQFFLLGIHGHDRCSCGQRTLGLGIDVAELCVSVGMIVAFFRLTVALQQRLSRPMDGKFF